MTARKNLSSKTSKKALTTKPEIVPTPEEIALANEAFDKIKNTFLKHYQNALLEVGEYIAITFYDDNPELFSNKSPVKEKSVSFNQLIKKLHGDDPNAPKSSWMYNAVNVYFDRKIIEKTDDKAFQTYGKLKPSCWVRLLPVKDIKKKINLIHATYDEKLSFKQLGERINPINDTKTSPVNRFKDFEKKVTAQVSNIRKSTGINGSKKEKALEDAYKVFLKKVKDILEAKEIDVSKETPRAGEKENR